MTISYPLALPAASSIVKSIVFKPKSVVGVSESPFTLEQQVYENQGQCWMADVTLKPMLRATAEAWVAWKLALNGRRGTFLMGDPIGKTARGTWAGLSPVVDGAGQSGLTLNVRGLTDGSTGAAGDWLQIGSGSGARLHKLTQAFTVAGSPTGYVSLDIWPRLRAAPADGAAITLASAQGVWRMTSNEMDWSIEIAQIYGLQFSCQEAL